MITPSYSTVCVFSLVLLSLLGRSLSTLSHIEVLKPTSPVSEQAAIVLNRKLYPDKFFYHIHVPKTGGQSLFLAIVDTPKEPKYNCNTLPCCDKTLNAQDDLIGRIGGQGNCSFFSYEVKPAMVNSVMGRDPAVFKGMSFFRDPMEHAFSALQHMKTMRPKEACQNATQYLAGEKCKMYNISNLQTTRMGYSPAAGEMDLATAIERTNKLFFVGIVQHYAASICLLRYQLGQFHKEACDCRRKVDQAGSIIPSVVNAGHYDRAHPEYSLDNFKKLRSRLELDYVLWNHALLLFYSRVRQVEQLHDIEMICGEDGLGNHSSHALRKYGSKHFGIGA